jgi:hypothetical protein
MKLLMLTIFLFQTLDKLAINAETPVLSYARGDGDPHVSPKRKFPVQANTAFHCSKGWYNNGFECLYNSLLWNEVFTSLTGHTNQENNNRTSLQEYIETLQW